ncbi:MAG TPA: PKD domain-containing protein [Phycisphaerae bacterium]|nr:PKD domain-containing protein [Phycisphaerae bacterium]
MFNRLNTSRPVSILAMSVLGLMFCTGSGGGEGCDADMELMEDLITDVSDISPTGTGYIDPTSSVAPPVTSTPPVAATPPTVSIGASTLQAGMNESVTFTATVTGGTPPYTNFWMLADDAGWTPGGNTFTRTISLSGTQTKTAYCAVVDAAGVYSEFAEITIAARQTSDACDSIAGTYRTAQGWVYVHLDPDAGGAPRVHSHGHYEANFPPMEDGRFSNQTLSTGAPGCPECIVLSGEWYTGLVSIEDSGSFEFTFSPDRKSFNGKWSHAGNSHWDASPWDGFRENCYEWLQNL